METIFKVYSAEMQNVLFYSALAMQPEETNKQKKGARNTKYLELLQIQNQFKITKKFLVTCNITITYLHQNWAPEIIKSINMNKNLDFYI